MAEEGGVIEVAEDVVEEAKALGWADKDQWRGNPDDWVDAETFVQRGRQVMPMLKKNNERLVQDMRAVSTRVATLDADLKAANAVIAALEESREADVKAGIEAERTKLKGELAAASRDGDHEAVADLTDQLTKLNADSAVAAVKPAAKTEAGEAATKVEIAPEITQWYQDNPEFMTNPRKVALARVVADELRAAGEKSINAEFLEKVREQVEKEFGGAATKFNKVAGGNGGGGRNNSGGGAGKTYADLPAEAKAACDKMAARLVGDSRAHKTIESWRKSYTSQYFKGE